MRDADQRPFTSLRPQIDRREFLATSAAVAATALARRSAVAEDQNKTWRVGVIGHTGRGNYGHGLDVLWQKLPNTEIVGLADANEKGREANRKKLGLETAFADYRAMIAETEPEIVAVCPRYIDEHRDMILAATAGGARGIYCEKPFCRTPREADEIVAACQESGTRLGLAHRNHYHPALPMITQAVNDGAIGQLLEIRCRGKEDQRGGAQDLWVLGTHLLDLARHFSGNATTCSAELLQGARPVTPEDVRDGAEGIGPIAGDRLHARYETDSGTLVYFDSIRGAGIKEANFGLQLIGNKGLIDLRIDIEPLAHYVPGNPFQPTDKPRPWIPITSGGIGKPEPVEGIKKLVAAHILAAQDLLAAINEQRDPLSSAADGRAIVEMINAAFASHTQNGARVSLPLESRDHPLATWRNEA